MATVSRNLIEILIRARDESEAVLKKSGDNVTAFERRFTLATAAVAAAGATLLASVSASAIAGARYASTLDDISKKTLVTTETIAALGTQLVKNGGQFEDVEGSVRTFSRAVIDAISGSKEAQAQFARLGISVDDLVGPSGSIRSFEELLPSVADGFAQLRDDAAKVDSAVALFGRTATSLVPVLSGGSAGLRQASDEARKFHAILSGNLQASAVRLGDRLGELKLSVLGVHNALAGSLDPTLGATISRLSAAAQAASEFAATHPTLTRNIISTAGALTALSALPGVIGLVTRALTAMRLEMIGGAIAAATFGKSLGPLFVMSRNAAGQFAGLRATTLGWTAGLGIAAAGVAALTVATGALISMQEEANKRARDDEAASKQHTATLSQETATIYEKARALEELRNIEGRQAVRQTREELATVGFRERIIFEEQSRQQALKEFDEKFAEFKSQIATRAARESLGIPAPKITIGDIELPVLPPIEIPAPLVTVEKTSITLPAPDIRFNGPTIDRVPVPTGEEIAARYQAALSGQTIPPITVNAPPVRVQSIDENDLNAQIARQRQVVERAQEELTRATRFRETADRQQDQTIRIAARTGEEEAINKLAQAEQRLFDMTQRAAEKTRDLARAATEAKSALLDFDLATGRISIDESIEANRRALDDSVAALNRARDAQAVTIPGTTAYAAATDRLTEAIQRESQARSRLSSSIDESTSRANEDRAAKAAATSATLALAQAEEDLATVRGARPGVDPSVEIATRNLERLRVAMEEARAEAEAPTTFSIQLPFSPVVEQPATVEPEKLQAAADATNAYTTALIQAQQSQRELNDTFDAGGLAVSSFGDLASAAIGSIGDGTIDAAALAKRMIASIIQELIRLTLAAKTAKAAMSLVGGFNPLSFIGPIIGIGPRAQSGGEIIRGIRGVDNVSLRVGRGENVLDHTTNDRLKRMLTTFEASSQPDVRHGLATAEVARSGNQVTNHLHFHGVLAGSIADAQRVSRKTYEATKDYVDTGIAQPRFT